MGAVWRVTVYLHNLGASSQSGLAAEIGILNAELRSAKARKGKVHLPQTPLNTDHSQIQENLVFCYLATEQSGQVGWEPMVYKC